MTNTTGMRILAARAIVSARHFDRLPSRKSAQQVAHQRGLSHFGGETTDGDNHGAFHHCLLTLTVNCTLLSNIPHARNSARVCSRRTMWLREIIPSSPPSLTTGNWLRSSRPIISSASVTEV